MAYQEDFLEGSSGRQVEVPSFEVERPDTLNGLPFRIDVYIFRPVAGSTGISTIVSIVGR